MTLTFTGCCARLADIDLPRIGYGIGVGEDELHAFLEVETNGGGFDARNRPKLLFEPHRFYANLSGSKRDVAVSQKLACQAWGGLGEYPHDSYPRLLAAIAIDETAALRSASWGIGQIMGENHVAAGYDTVQAMVLAMVEGGEAEQLTAAVRFIKANHLDDDLRDHKWAAFAQGYNGPGYARNAYDAKLASAYLRWSRIRDTPWKPGAVQTVAEVVPSATTLAIALAKAPEDHVVIGPAAAKAAPATPIDVKILVVGKPAPPPDPPSRTPAQPAPAGFFARLAAGLRALDDRQG